MIVIVCIIVVVSLNDSHAAKIIAAKCEKRICISSFHRKFFEAFEEKKKKKKEREKTFREFLN